MRRESWKKVVREKKGSAPAAVVVVAKETSTLLCVNKKTMATQFRQLNLQVKITKKREKKVQRIVLSIPFSTLFVYGISNPNYGSRPSK